jgi:hypothetical protein
MIQVELGRGRGSGPHDFWYVSELFINNGDLELQLGVMHNISQILDFEVARVQPLSDSTMAVLETVLYIKQYCQIKEATATNLTAGLRRSWIRSCAASWRIRFLTDYAWKESPFVEAHHSLENQFFNLTISRQRWVLGLPVWGG